MQRGRQTAQARLVTRRARAENRRFSPAVGVAVAAAELPLTGRTGDNRLGRRGNPVGARGGGRISLSRTADRCRRGRLVLGRIGRRGLVLSRGRRHAVVRLVVGPGGVVQLLATRQVGRLGQGQLVLGVGDGG